MKRTFLACWILVGCSVVSPAADPDDVQHGHYWDAMLQDSMQVYEDEDLTASVAAIGDKVAAASGNPNRFDFRFVVINGADPTAFSAPGGYVYVTTGLLQSVASADELAAVIGHEIAHVNQRHGMKNGMSGGRKKFWTTVIRVGAIVGGALAGAYVQDAMISEGLNSAYDAYSAYQAAMLVNRFTQLATTELGQSLLSRVSRGYREEFEFEADSLAMSYIREAGYRPEAMASLYERLVDRDSPNQDTTAPLGRLHSSTGTLERRIGELAPVPQ